MRAYRDRRPSFLHEHRDATTSRERRWKVARASEGLGPRHQRHPWWALSSGVALLGGAALLWLIVGLDVPLSGRLGSTGFVFALLAGFGAVLTALSAHDLLRDRRDRAAGRPTELSADGERFVELGDSAGERSGATG